MATSTPNLADQWKGLSSDERDEALSRMTDDQKQQLATSLGFQGQAPAPKKTAPQAPASAANPGFFSRLAESVGIPTSTAQAHQMQSGSEFLPGHPVLNAIAGPAGMAVRAISNYGQNLYNKATEPMTPVEQADAKVHPIGQAANQAAKFIEEGVLAPVGGQAVSNIATDVGNHNLGATGGDVLGSLVNLLSLKKAGGPGAEGQLNKLTYAAGPKAAGPLEQTVGMLHDTAQATGAPTETVGHLRDLVNKTKDSINTEYGNAIGPYANMRISTEPIRQRVLSLITPDMQFTAEGRAEIAAIKKAADEYMDKDTLANAGVSPTTAQTPPLPSRASTVADRIGDMLQRRIRDDAGQGVLDEMEANGEKVGDVSNRFWNDTYWKMPGPVQRQFQGYVSKLWGGLKPGDTIAIAADKTPIVGKDWMDMAEKLGLSDNPEHLEGIERGYVTLMREANNRVGDIQKMGAASNVRPKSPLLAQGEAIVNPPAQSQPKGWTLGALDSKRSRLSADLASHNAKEGVARYTAERGNTNLAIDSAINDALRDTVYPQADQLAGKPAGYFEDLKQKQSNLIRLQSLLNRRIDDLTGAQRAQQGAPLGATVRGGVYATSEGAPHGYIGNLMGLLRSASKGGPLSDANKAVQGAFQSGGPVSKTTVLSYPVRALSLNPPTPWYESQQ